MERTKQMTEEELDLITEQIIDRWKAYRKKYSFELDGIEIEFDASGYVSFVKDYKCWLGEDKTLPETISTCSFESFDDVVEAIASIRKAMQKFLMIAARRE